MVNYSSGGERERVGRGRKRDAAEQGVNVYEGGVEAEKWELLMKLL